MSEELTFSHWNLLWSHGAPPWVSAIVLWATCFGLVSFSTLISLLRACGVQGDPATCWLAILFPPHAPSRSQCLRFRATCHLCR